MSVSGFLGAVKSTSSAGPPCARRQHYVWTAKRNVAAVKMPFWRQRRRWRSGNNSSLSSEMLLTFQARARNIRYKADTGRHVPRNGHPLCFRAHALTPMFGTIHICRQASGFLGFLVFRRQDASRARRVSRVSRVTLVRDASCRRQPVRREPLDGNELASQRCCPRPAQQRPTRTFAKLCGRGNTRLGQLNQAEIHCAWLFRASLLAEY